MLDEQKRRYEAGYENTYNWNLILATPTGVFVVNNADGAVYD